MTYSFHPLTAKELEEALAHYLAVESELAIRFLDEAESAITRILAYPNAWQKLRENVRRCRLKHLNTDWLQGAGFRGGDPGGNASPARS